MSLSEPETPDRVQLTQNTLLQKHFPIATIILSVILVVTFWHELKFDHDLGHSGPVTLQTLVALGAASRELAFSGEFYRLLATGFLNDSFGIFFLNLCFLLVAGCFLEIRVGWLCLLAVFFIGSITGTIFSVLLSYPLFVHAGSIYAVTAVVIAQSIAAPSHEFFRFSEGFRKKHWSRIRPHLVLFLPLVLFRMNPSYYFAGLLGAATVGLGCGVLFVRRPPPQALNISGKSLSRYTKTLGVVVGVSVLMTLYAVYAVSNDHDYYAYLKGAAPADQAPLLSSYTRHGSNSYVRFYPRDPIGYLFAAQRELEKKHYAEAEAFSKRGLSLKAAIDHPNMSVVKTTLLYELALSLKAEGRDDEAKEWAKLPCSAWRQVSRPLQNKGLCS